MITAEIGVFGGSGLYSLLDDVERVEVDTPYGPPSDAVHAGRVNGRPVAFLPRHGADHRFPPHRVPYRAAPSCGPWPWPPGGPRASPSTTGARSW